MTLSTGNVVNGTDAIGPLWDRTDACSDGDNNGRWVLTLVEATFCQPWWGSFGSRSFNLLAPGLTPPASASQLGILAPTVFKRSVESATDPKHLEDRVATPFKLRGAGLQSSPNCLPNSPNVSSARCPNPSLPMSKAWWRPRGCMGATSLSGALC